SPAFTTAPPRCCSKLDSCRRTTPSGSTTTSAPWPAAPTSTRARPRSSSASSGRSNGPSVILSEAKDLRMRSWRSFAAAQDDEGSPRRVRVVEAVADHLDELLEIERLEDGIADGVGRNLVDAALSRGGEDDDVRAPVGHHVLDPLDELVAVDARHHQVEED